VELKCPAAKTHVRYLLDNAALVADYRIQVQFGLWLTGWPSWSLVSYCPSLPPVCLDLGPEAEVHAALTAEVPKVIAARAEALARIEGMRGEGELPADPDARDAAIVFGWEGA
jgi:hypothetical protein